MDEVFKATYDDSEIMAKLERLEKQVLAISKSVDAMGDTATQSLNQAAGAADNFSQSMDTAATDTAKQAKAVEGARAANQTWLQSIRQTIAGQQLGGKSLGEWAEQARGFSVQIAQGAKSIASAGNAMRIFNGILKVSGIGLLIGLVASAIQYFTKFQSGIDKVSQIMASLNAVANVMIDRFLKLGSGLLKMVGGDIIGGARDMAAAFDDVGGAIADAAVQAFNLEKRLQALRDVTITQSVEAARARVELEKFRQVADDGTRSINERARAAKSAAEIEKQLAQQAVDRALEAQQIAQGKFALDKESLAAREAAAKAEVDFQEAVGELNKVNFEAEKQQREFRKEAAAERQKQLDAESKALEKLLKDLDTLRAAVQSEGIERDLAEVEKKYNALQKIAADGVEALRKIETRRNLTPDELAQLEELGKIRVKLEEQRLSALVDVVATYAEKDIEIEEALQKSKEALRQKDYDMAVQNLETAKKLREQEIAILEQQLANFITVLEANGIDKEEIDERKLEQDKVIQKARLESELQFQTDLLEIAKAGDSEAVAQIENTIKLIQEKLAGIGTPPGEPPKTGGLLELLGLTPDQIKGLELAAQEVIKSLNQIADARVKEADAAVDAAERRVSAAQEALIREQDLAEQGLANNTDLAKQQLDTAKKLQEEAEKERAKAIRTQILLDAASQISSLITSSASIFKSLAPLGPFGIAGAIATIAVMFGAFASAKASALKAAAIPKFRKGGKLDGPSHEYGGIAVSDRDGNVYGEAEGGEWIVNRHGSREHDRFLSRLNDGEFAGVNLDRLFRPSASNPITEAAPRIERIEREFREIRETQHTRALESAYREAARDIVTAIQEKEVVTPLTNYRITKKRGRNTFTKIVKAEN